MAWTTITTKNKTLSTPIKLIHFQMSREFSLHALINHVTVRQLQILGYVSLPPALPTFAYLSLAEPSTRCFSILKRKEMFILTFPGGFISNCGGGWQMRRIGNCFATSTPRRSRGSQLHGRN